MAHCGGAASALFGCGWRTVWVRLAHCVGAAGVLCGCGWRTMWVRLAHCVGAAINSVTAGCSRAAVAVFVVVIDGVYGAGVCVVTRYFNDYNTLESTFLTCGILVLLGGIAYSVATFSSQVYFDILEYIVLLIVVVSTVICAFTILTELAQSIKYFALASQANRRMKVRPGVRWYPFDAASGVIENRFMV